jgi:hypothetical protein
MTRRLRRIACVVPVIAISVLAAVPARALEGPWCASLYDDGGENCSLPSFAQCLAHIHGPGGRCYENVMYRAPAQRVVTPKQRKKVRRNNARD